MKKTEEPIIVEQVFEICKERIWRSITELEEMLKWYFDNIPDFEPVVGFRTEFNVISGERNFLHKWSVTEVVPNEKIVYNWQYEGYEGSADVCFQIFDLGSKAKLELKVIVLEDFAEGIPEFSRESCTNGWNYFINERLKEYLASDNQ
jgi:uncharacterized protein YndB with AHSA1/START domain